MKLDVAKKIRVLLADDNTQIRSRVAELLSPEFEIVGTAANGEEACAAVSRLQPDVLVLDIVMPVLDGIQTARRLKAVGCSTKIVFLSGMEDQEYVEAAMAANASGFVFKPQMVADLPCAIREAHHGRIFVSTKQRIGMRPPAQTYKTMKHEVITN